MKAFLYSFAVILMFGFLDAQAASKKGGHSLGFGLILMSPGQDDLNKVIDQLNASENISVDKLGAAYEFAPNYQYRLKNSIFALHFRPSLFIQSASGGGYKTELTGFTFFPLVRFYPLENKFIHMYMQFGVGYGRLNGKISGTNGSVAWNGGNFGALGGLGIDFCFTPSHCFGVEGNFRYLPLERNITSSASGNTGFSVAPSAGDELENNNVDVATTLSGVQGMLSYQMIF